MGGGGGGRGAVKSKFTSPQCGRGKGVEKDEGNLLHPAH
jgi:hypothetical protein